MSHVSADDPEQTENTDAVKGGVGLPRDGWGGAEDTLGGSLKGEHVEEVGQKASRRAPRALTAAICQRYSIHCKLKSNISLCINEAKCPVLAHYYFTLATFPQCVGIHFIHGGAVVLQSAIEVEAGVQTQRLCCWTDLFVPLPFYYSCMQRSCKRNCHH